MQTGVKKSRSEETIELISRTYPCGQVLKQENLEPDSASR